MKEETLLKLKAALIFTYLKFGNKTVLITENKSYTGDELAEEISQETEFGVKLIDNMIQLTVDLLSRQKISI